MFFFTCKNHATLYRHYQALVVFESREFRRLIQLGGQAV